MAGSLEEMASKCDHSWLKQLSPDPETAGHEPNRTSRQVRSGHYVLVQPTPLPRPALVMHSPHMAGSLGLSVRLVARDHPTSPPTPRQDTHAARNTRITPAGPARYALTLNRVTQNEAVQTAQFARLFSGDMTAVQGAFQPFATP